MSKEPREVLDWWGPALRALNFLTRKSPWIAGKVNSIAINELVNACPHRPHPWSTVSDYTSWLALSDKTWSARHLPAYYPDANALPDIQKLVGMFKRPTGEQRLSPKSTCLFPAFAQYLTDGFIRTKMPVGDEPNTVRKRNTSNHEIDLCPLYGRTEEQTAALRLLSESPGQKGRLKSQMIGPEEFPPYLLQADGKTPKPEFAALDPPLGLNNISDPSWLPYIFAAGGDRANASPLVAMMNALWLREHNRMALALERENPAWDDERVFQTARNTLIVEYIKVVVEDYINHISPAPFKFMADPSVCWEAGWNKPNWITTEFSLLYRWHSLIPDQIVWNGVSVPAGQTIFNNQLLVAGPLESAFVSLSAQKAGHLGAFNTADALLGIELNSITQGRVCNVATYSDYRHYASLSRPSKFEDISTDPNVVRFLSGIYKTVDDVEFYVGLFAEDTVENSPLPELINALVAVDAFSQALPNPLLSKEVFKESTFSKVGWDAIQNTSKLEDVVRRNSPPNTAHREAGRISMTQADWRHKW